MTRKPAPRRQRSHDRITSPGAVDYPGRIKCDMILAPLDRLHRAMDLKWGIDRLVDTMPIEPPAHVPPEARDGFRTITARYGDLVETLNKALDANDAETIALVVPRMMKAITMMDQHCERAGLLGPVQVFEVDFEGERIGFIQDPADWQRAEQQRPGLPIHTFAEAAAAMANRATGAAMIGQAAKLFPGAEIAGTGIPFVEKVGDSIPF